MSPRRRVVVTGLGVITPIGHDVPAFWDNLVQGKSGAGPITLFDTEKFATKIGAEVKDYEPADHFERKELRRVERFAQFAVIAAREAAAQSGLLASGLDPTRIGCVMGGGIGGINYIEQTCLVLDDRGPGRVSPFLIPRIITNMAPGQVAIDLGLKGPNLAMVTACAAGTNAIGEATEMIRRGAATAMIAGSSEAGICPIAVAGFEKMRAVCMGHLDHPELASRPFDANRCGFLMGEGGGALVLEDREHALARGVPILAEIAGYGTTCDAYHVTAPAPEGEGSARALKIAIEDSGLPLGDIGYINAHGTATSMNDALETKAIKTVFGEHAASLAVSSNKSMIGHLLAAAGAVEAVATVKTLTEQILPPTINLENPDPDCDLDYVPGTARKVEGLRAALSNSLGFGGHNAVIALTLDGHE